MRARLLSMLVGATFATAPGASAQDGLALFHKMQAALGGADQIAAVHDFEEQIRAEAFDSKGRSLGEVEKRTRWIRPNTLRIDQVGPFDTYVLYFDGARGWEIVPDKQGVQVLAGSELQFAHDYARNFDLNVYVADRDPTCKITSPEPNAIHIACSDDSPGAMDIFLDAATRLPLHDGSLSPPDAAHPKTSGMLFEEWKTVNGVRYASRRANYHDGARVGELIDSFIMVNGGLKVNDMAAKPADLKPILRELGK